MRALIHFPIIHSPQDLGGLNAAVAQSRTEQQARQHLAAIEQFWQAVAATIDALALNYAQLKLYQDGLPVCGKEQEIVTDVAAKGSPNYLLLQSLMNKGATLIGTESAELLLQEHALMTQRLQGEAKQTAETDAEQALLNLRDSYIAHRIDSTLQENEMAILFLGLMHQIENKLPNDIVLIQPLGKPTGVTIKT